MKEGTSKGINPPMAPLGRLSKRLRALLAGRLDQRGLVVWYDP